MKIIISMTTVPWRINAIEPTINSIIRQGNYDLFVLNCPEKSLRTNESYKIPTWIKNKVYVNSCVDYGPATKLLPVLHITNNPDDIIITIDDDVVYDKQWLNYLILWANEISDKALGYMGASFDQGGFVHGQNLIIPKAVEVLGGYLGIAYRRSFFLPDVFNKLDHIMKRKFLTVDDHFFAAYLQYRGISKYVIPNPYINSEVQKLDGGIYDPGSNSNAGESLKVLKNEMKNW